MFQKVFTGLSNVCTVCERHRCVSVYTHCRTVCLHTCTHNQPTKCGATAVTRPDPGLMLGVWPHVIPVLLSAPGPLSTAPPPGQRTCSQLTAAFLPWPHSPCDRPLGPRFHLGGFHPNFLATTVVQKRSQTTDDVQIGKPGGGNVTPQKQVPGWWLSSDQRV